MVFHKKTRSKLAMAVAGVCSMEGLEDRRLLTTLVGGDVFDYRDANEEIVRITLSGNVRAEFVAAIVSDVDNSVILGDLIPQSVPEDVAGADLYAIYVDQGDLDAYISITRMVDDDGTLEERPFEGNVTLRVVNANNGQDLVVTTPGNTGPIYLGALTVTIEGQQDSENRPILSAPMPADIGIMPAQGTLTPGLYIVDDVDLGKFLFGGTISGRVDAGGSIDLFYAGNVLTGDTGGEFVSSFPALLPTNFNVDGDLRSLIVKGSIGTQDGSGPNPDEPNYLTRFQMRVGGHLGKVDASEAIIGKVEANDRDQSFINRNYTEIEARGEFMPVPGTFFGPEPTFQGGFIAQFDTALDADFFNDNFNTPEYLGSLNGSITLDGILQALDRDRNRDWTDYYGVALLAGQTVTVQITDTTFPVLPPLPGQPEIPIFPTVEVGVYDPDGRLIATNYSDVGFLDLFDDAFQFTADRPGVYRIAVGEIGDPDFNGPGGEFSVAGHIGPSNYRVQLDGVGNLAIGGISAGTNFFEPEITVDGVVAHNGDVGAVVAGQTAIFSPKFDILPPPGPPGTPPPPVPDIFSIRSRDGNIRSLVAQRVGRQVNNAIGGGPELTAPLGDVGLIRATDADDATSALDLNNNQLFASLSILTNLAPSGLVRNYQLIDAAGTFVGAVIADAKIGIIRAGDMTTLTPSVFTANADRVGNDGVIDLIDVQGNFGTLQGGGPHITTGPRGNVRYINVGGTLFRDEAFGGGQPEPTRFSPGRTATVFDDSGAKLRISPGTNGSLSILTYGIRGSGGSAIVRIDTTNSVNIRSDPRRVTSPAEIGLIRTTGNGADVIRLANGSIGLDPFFAGPNVNVEINGKAPVDVFWVRGGRFTRINNNTSGEIVNVLSESIGLLQGQNIGTPKSSTPAAVNGLHLLVVGPNYPYNDQRIGVISSDIVQVKSYGQLGNIIVDPALVTSGVTRIDPSVAVNVTDNFGAIRTVTADANNKRAATGFEGITGPVYASAEIDDVSIGAGIMPSGSGNLGRAGLFASGPIGNVRGRLGANIRGNIISEDSIGRIDLTNGGSIINANISVLGDLSDAREFMPSITIPQDADSLDNPVFDIGGINLTGDATTRRPPRRPKPQARGGIIGTFFAAADIGSVILKGGSFGIINSVFALQGEGVLNKLQTDGYGLRNLIISGGARIGDLIALGNGASLSTALFSSELRQSETQSIDPFFGFAPNSNTDLHKVFGTSRVTPTIAGITNTGIIAGTSAAASRDLDSLVAWSLVGNTDNPAIFNFANKIEKIDIAQDIFGVSIITGAVDSFRVGRDVINLDMTVAGPIESIFIGRHYDITSRIHAIGPDGTIDDIFVGGNLDGDIIAEGSVGRLRVNGQYNGDVLADGVRVPES